MNIHILSMILIFFLSPLMAVGAEVPERSPVVIGLDAEYQLKNSTSAQAIEMGIRVAIQEINEAGGVLGGRPLRLETRDDRSVPSRAMENYRELAAIPDMVALFCGRFSPVVLEMLPTVRELGLILLDPWASADGIVRNGFSPNPVFRLSLQDRFAMPTLLHHALGKGYKRVALLLPNTGWGRSNLNAAQRHGAENPEPALVGTAWYNWGDQSLIDTYQQLRGLGAQAIIFVANDTEAVILVREVAALPIDQRLPLISHWGVTGGRFAEGVGTALEQVDYSVVQTFSFLKADPARVAKFLASARKLYDIPDVAVIPSPVGVGHAYDLTHILARAINLAGTTERGAIRAALEQVRDYQGLVKDFPQPFSADNHEALGREDVFMARFRKDGAIIPLDMDPSR